MLSVGWSIAFGLELGFLTIVPTMPWCADTVSSLPALLGIWDCCDFANDFVAWDNWRRVAKQSMLDSAVGMTDSAGKDFHQDLEHRPREVNIMEVRRDSSGRHTSPGFGSSNFFCLKTSGWPLASKTAALYSLGRLLGAMMI